MTRTLQEIIESEEEPTEEERGFAQAQLDWPWPNDFSVNQLRGLMQFVRRTEEQVN